MWVNIARRFVRFSLLEFFLVTRLRYFGNIDKNRLEKTPSRLKNRYFSKLKALTHEDVRETFLAASGISNEDVSMLGVLYFITSYLYPRDNIEPSC